MSYERQDWVPIPQASDKQSGNCQLENLKP
jgi:hypothetical protein